MALGPGQVALTSCRLNKLRLDAGRLNAVLGPPLAPHTPTPAPGFSGGPYQVSWGASGGASSYDVYYGTTPTPPLYTGNLTGTAVNVPAQTPGLTYYWYVVAKNIYGTTTGPLWTFTAAVPPVPTSLLPPHTSGNNPNTITLSWTQPSMEPFLTWTVRFGTSPTAPPIIASGLTSPSYALPTPLANATRYYWAPRAVNNAGMSPDSGNQYFDTWVLGAASTPFPADGAVDVSLSAILTWGAALNATSYDVLFGTGSPPTNVVQQGPGLSYDPPGDLAVDLQYYWRIRSRNSGGTTDGPIWTFTSTDPNRLIIRIDGVAPHMRIAGLSIQDNLNDAPNTCAFVVDTTPPHVGQVVEIGLGSVTGSDLLFAGTIQAVEEFYEGQRPVNRAWRVSCIDWWQRLNRTLVRRHYAPQSASAIAIDLVTRYSLGFSTAAIAAGLPTVDGGIDFTDEELGLCLRRLLQRVGGYWYVDYSKVVHAFLTETTAPPDALTPTTPTLLADPSLTDARDLSQIRTRVLVEGGGAQATVEVLATETRVPIEDASWYNPAGGLVVSGTQRIPYTSLVVGGGGSFVQGMTGPVGGAGTPAAAIAEGAGGVLGTVNYRASFRNSAGETVPGPASNSVLGVAFARPPVGLFATAATGIGRLIGAYSYVVTFTTARGETDPTTPAAFVTLVAWPTPNAPTLTPGGFGPLVGQYGYRVTFVTQYGETTAGPAASYTATALAAPSAPGVAEVAGQVAPLVGAYSYRVAYLTAYGETLPGTVASLTVTGYTPSAPTAAVTDIGPLIGVFSYRVAFVSALGESLGTASGTVTATVVTAQQPSVSGDGTGAEIAYAVAYVHPVYGPSAQSPRTVDTNKGTNPVVIVNGLPAGCGWTVYSTGTVTAGTGASAPMYRVADMGVGAPSFTHTTQTGPGDGGVLATLGRAITVSSIPTGPTGTTSRRIYRTKAGGSAYFLVGQLDNNTATTMVDATPDGALTQTAPAANVNGHPVLLNLPTGPAGTLGRRLYRTKVGGSTYFRIGEVDHNTAGATYTDTTPDSALTVQAPILATAGGETITVTVPTGPTGTTARRLYRTTAGGASYRHVAELADNTTSTYTDGQPDAGLGATTVPTVHTAGGQQIAVGGIPLGPVGTTGRRLYRTRAGGVDYYLAAEIPNNTTSTLTDGVIDTDLGPVAPTANTAGASIVSVTGIPTGDATITARRLYRRDSAGLYRRVADLGDNTTTTYLDATAEEDLGELAPTVSTIGAVAGATSLQLADASAFPAAGGWAKSGSQRFRYSGVSGNTLTGIPASGPGALVAPLRAGAEVLLESMLVGATLEAPIAAGDPVLVLAIVNDAAAQAELAALEGGDSTGIYEHRLSDSRLAWADAAATGTADLRLFARPIATLRYASRDRKTASGKTVHADIPGLAVLGDYLIQTVTIDQIGIAKGLLPRYTVEASSVRWTFEDLLRQIVVRP